MEEELELFNYSTCVRVYPECFVGSEAVRFMLFEGIAENSMQAELIGNELSKLGLIHHYSKIGLIPFENR